MAAAAKKDKAEEKESKKAEKTFSVLACGCTSEYQDLKYGAGMRAHNPTSKGTCCTVCGANKG